MLAISGRTPRVLVLLLVKAKRPQVSKDFCKVLEHTQRACVFKAVNDNYTCMHARLCVIKGRAPPLCADDAEPPDTRS